MAVQIILLEKVENLGVIGDKVSVKSGYARNFLIPQGKALRATNENVAFFEKEKVAIEKVNAEKRKDAEKEAKKLEGLTINLIRQASEGGQLYGGITATDIAAGIATKDVSIRRGQVDMNQSFKAIGLFSVNIILHPEVVVPVQLNIARSEDEAAIQLKTGKALIAAGTSTVQEQTEELEDTLLDDSAIKANKAAKEAEAQAAEEQVEKDAKSAEKAAKKKAKKTEEASSEEE
jgi:large subunit ribosomal protein L9